MVRSSLLRAVVTVGVVLVCAGCWPVPGQNSDRTAYNEFETAITSQTVGDLTELWTWWHENGRGPGGQINDLVTSAAGVHVTSGPSLPDTGAIVGSCDITTLDPATGQVKWSRTLLTEQGRDCADSDPNVGAASGDPYGEEDFVAFGSMLMQPSGSGYDVEARSAVFNVHTGEAQPGWDHLGVIEAMRGSLIAGEVGAWDPVFGRSVIWTRINSRFGTRDLAIPGGIQNSATLGTDKLYVTDEGRFMSQPCGAPGRGPCVRAYTVMESRPWCGVPPAIEDCPLWATPVYGEPVSRPVLGDNRTTVYVGTTQGVVYALDANTGAVKWNVWILGSGIHASPAVARGRLYVPTTTGLVVLDAANGARLWDGAVTGDYGDIMVQPAVAGDVVFTGSQDGTLRAFDADGCGATTCEPIWSSGRTGWWTTGAPVVSGGRVYVGQSGGRVVAYGLPASASERGSS